MGFPLFLKRKNKYFHSTLKVASDDKFCYEMFHYYNTYKRHHLISLPQIVMGSSRYKVRFDVAYHESFFLYKSNYGVCLYVCLSDKQGRAGAIMLAFLGHYFLAVPHEFLDQSDGSVCLW